MTPLEMESRIVRYGTMVPSAPAFADPLAFGGARTDDFAILATEKIAAARHVHITEAAGFLVTATRQPPGCHNALHSHKTAETVIVLNGRWRFFWGRKGAAGQVILDAGDIFNIPTSLFRGFENVGDTHGTLVTILGGEDAGGGVTWAPEALADLRAEGRILADDGRLYDVNGVPEGTRAVAPLPEGELERFAEPCARDVITGYVSRYWDLMAMAERAPTSVVGAEGILPDKPGFEVEFLRDGSIADKPSENADHEVLVVMKGHWRVRWRGGSTALAPGDTMAVPPRFAYGLEPALRGEAGLYRVRSTPDPAGETWRP